MIKDHINHANRYASVHPLFPRAFEWLAEHANQKFQEGRIELDGVQLIALPQHYETHGFNADMFEAHQRYIDIQYVASGSEHIHVGAPETMTCVSLYDTTKDVAFFKGIGSILTVNAGEFVVLWPHEAHVPGCHPAEAPTPVSKIVLKVAVVPQ